MAIMIYRMGYFIDSMPINVDNDNNNNINLESWTKTKQHKKEGCKFCVCVCGNGWRRVQSWRIDEGGLKMNLFLQQLSLLSATSSRVIGQYEN